MSNYTDEKLNENEEVIVRSSQSQNQVRTLLELSKLIQIPVLLSNICHQLSASLEDEKLKAEFEEARKNGLVTDSLLETSSHASSGQKMLNIQNTTANEQKAAEKSAEPDESISISSGTPADDDIVSDDISFTSDEELDELAPVSPCVEKVHSEHESWMTQPTPTTIGE